jgi:RNA polymerase sigma-70 factor (ECF subfamily)
MMGSLHPIGNARATQRAGLDHNAAMANHPDDTLMALIDRVAQRDEIALKALYDLTSGKLYGLALRVLGNHGWAEDALQDTFLQIWRTAPDYRASLSPPMAWLGLIVRSRSLDLLRRRKADREHLRDEIDDQVADTLEGDSPNPMDTSLASQQAWALHQCLGRLDNKQREVVSLAYLRDLSHGELAEQLRLPLGTVKTWIRRGLDQLRICMAGFA